MESLSCVLWTWFAEVLMQELVGCDTCSIVRLGCPCRLESGVAADYQKSAVIAARMSELASRVPAFGVDQFELES